MAAIKLPRTASEITRPYGLAPGYNFIGDVVTEERLRTWKNNACPDALVIYDALCEAFGDPCTANEAYIEWCLELPKLNRPSVRWNAQVFYYDVFIDHTKFKKGVGEYVTWCQGVVTTWRLAR